MDLDIRTWWIRDHLNIQPRNPQTIHYMVPNDNPELKEYRYEERHDEYALRCWHDGTETFTHGLKETRPSWLVAIVDAGIVGGYSRRAKEPPPDMILWFCTDTNNHLDHFIEMT